jgi:hypothetical protein
MVKIASFNKDAFLDIVIVQVTVITLHLLDVTLTLMKEMSFLQIRFVLEVFAQPNQ